LKGFVGSAQRRLFSAGKLLAGDVAMRCMRPTAAPFDAVARFPRGFTPHLSVGQARGDDALQRWLADLGSWRPISFTVREVSVIVRGSPPDDVFRVAATITLGGAR
jgi:2'-5' RNA ligase superfamily